MTDSLNEIFDKHAEVEQSSYEQNRTEVILTLRKQLELAHTENMTLRTQITDLRAENIKLTYELTKFIQQTPEPNSNVPNETL